MLENEQMNECISLTLFQKIDFIDEHIFYLATCDLTVTIACTQLFHMLTLGSKFECSADTTVGSIKPL